jgi:hypothetical protein
MLVNINNTAPRFWWFIPPMYGDLGDDLLLFYPHYKELVYHMIYPLRKSWKGGWGGHFWTHQEYIPVTMGPRWWAKCPTPDLNWPRRARRGGFKSPDLHGNQSISHSASGKDPMSWDGLTMRRCVVFSGNNTFHLIHGLMGVIHRQTYTLIPSIIH